MTENQRSPRFSLRTLVLGFLALNTVISACVVFYYALVIGNSRFRTEWDHGIKLPTSARNFQCRGDAFKLVLDRNAISLFEMDTADAQIFFSLFKIESEFTLQSAQTVCDPLNPTPLHYAIPVGGTTPAWTSTAGTGLGNVYKWRKTWSAQPTVIRSMHCKSPVGDWLQIIEWEVDGHRLIQLHTDWN